MFSLVEKTALFS